MYRSTVDLNCDMGEGFGQWTYGDAPDMALMPLISSANVATGYHAGDPNQMDAVARLAAEHGVALGAHPGYDDLQGFGRRTIKATPEELVNDVIYQTGALREFGRRYGISLQHVKPHGALYMDFAADADMSHQLVTALQTIERNLYIFCMSVSQTCAIAVEAGQPVIREFFADRDYDASGSMVFIRKMRKLDPAEVAAKCVRACVEGKVRTVDGEDIEVPFESICFHSDTPGALDIGKAVRAQLLENGVRVAAPGQSS